MKTLIGKSQEPVPEIGKSIYTEKYSDGSEFYCLMDKYGNFNVEDTGRTYEEIIVRVNLWKDLARRHVIAVK